MLTSGLPSSLVDSEMASLEVSCWNGAIEALEGRASFSLNFDLGAPDDSRSEPGITLTSFLESPGQNVWFHPTVGELIAGKAAHVGVRHGLIDGHV